MHFHRSAAALLMGLLSLPALAQTQPACGAAAPCQVDGGEYFAALPANSGAAPLPAVLFFHGWGSSGKNVISNPGIAGVANERGYAVIAPQGLVPPGQRNRSWAHQGSPSEARDEVPFVRAVMSDAVRRLNIDPDRVLVSGFSQGGSMAWHVACFDADRYAAFAPISGAFWRPHPDECPSPAARLLHVHGEADTVVPLRGRPIGRRWYQGDVFEALDSLRIWRSCTSGPVNGAARAGLACRHWSQCRDGGDIELCLHDGGHKLPPRWISTMLEWYEQPADS